MPQQDVRERGDAAEDRNRGHKPAPVDDKRQHAFTVEPSAHLPSFTELPRPASPSSGGDAPALRMRLAATITLGPDEVQSAESTRRNVRSAQRDFQMGGQIFLECGGPCTGKFQAVNRRVTGAVAGCPAPLSYTTLPPPTHRRRFVGGGTAGRRARRQGIRLDYAWIIHLDAAQIPPRFHLDYTGIAPGFRPHYTWISP